MDRPESMREGPRTVDPAPSAFCTGSGKPPVEGTQRKEWFIRSGVCPDCALRVQIGTHIQIGLCFKHGPWSPRAREAEQQRQQKKRNRNA